MKICSELQQDKVLTFLGHSVDSTK